MDVYRPPHKEYISSTHIGRGGAANVFRPSHEEVAKAKKENAKSETSGSGSESGDEENDGEDGKGLAEKGKQWLFGNKD